MKPLILPGIILFLLSSAASCSHSQKTRGTPEASYVYSGESIIAWNEDSVLSYLFLLEKDKRFLYTIAERNKDGQPEKKRYVGVAKWGADTLYGVDTLFMQFNKKTPPPALLEHYLVVEMSGNYLIQPFTNSSKRIFMRIRRRPMY